MRNASIGLIACAACGGGGAHSPMPPVIGNAAGGAATGDDDFKALAKAVAAKMGAQLDGWGTAPIADDGREHRYAVLRNGTDRFSDGGYLIEASSGQDWLIAFSDDGHTGAWMSQETSGNAAPLWKEGDSNVVHHKAGHARGEELIDFDLERGVPTARSYGYLGDARDGDQLETTDYTGKHEKLADLQTSDAQIRVAGPAADADTLTRNLAPP